MAGAKGSGAPDAKQRALYKLTRYAAFPAPTRAPSTPPRPTLSPEACGAHLNFHSSAPMRGGRAFATRAIARVFSGGSPAARRRSLRSGHSIPTLFTERMRADEHTSPRHPERKFAGRHRAAIRQGWLAHFGQHAQLFSWD